MTAARSEIIASVLRARWTKGLPAITSAAEVGIARISLFNAAKTADPQNNFAQNVQKTQIKYNRQKIDLI
jgi:hypothetical protein